MLGDREDVLVAAAAHVHDQEVIGRNFYNLIRWQSYKYVARHSLAFFTNDY